MSDLPWALSMKGAETGTQVTAPTGHSDHSGAPVSSPAPSSNIQHTRELGISQHKPDLSG